MMQGVMETFLLYALLQFWFSSDLHSRLKQAREFGCPLGLGNPYLKFTGSVVRIGLLSIILYTPGLQHCVRHNQNQLLVLFFDPV